VRPLTGYRRKPRGLGVHAPARGLSHKWRTHTLPSGESQGSPRNHSSPRDPLYQWHEMFRLIVTELFYTTRAVLRRMIPARKGKIINIAAAGGIDPYPGPYTAYCAARGAIVTLTKALGREVAPYNIQVNAIAQNWVKNPSYFTEEEIATPEFQEGMKRRLPIGRLAEPWEQAKLAAFLASEDSNFLCGTVIPFAGGEVL
jgi:2-keto-3-deoxy-L-fuconate dehydrogenase